MTNNKKNVFWSIHNNYNYLNKMMVEEMDIASEHSGITGNFREEMWMKLFRSIIPQKYSMAQGVMIIDSDGNVSNEVDIAVFDEQYTPYVFQYNTLKFIPIEAVALVIECKSSDLPTKSLTAWSKSINDLTTKSSGIARMVTGYVSGLTNQTQKGTRPIKILASNKVYMSESGSDNLEYGLGEHFDFIIHKQQDEETIFKLFVKNGNKSLAWWARKLNGVKDGDENLKIEHLSLRESDLLDKQKMDGFSKEYPELKLNERLYLTNTLQDLHIKDNPFLSLNLQLNQLLMLINNPMLFPHFAYAKRFNEIIEREQEKVREKERQEVDCK
ncbi:hypothetical protein M3650_23660 [Paenibacillus sp. MER TA 81-3]|uniref:DUF6602 domain-containing protein n=1 Tax=Paenibacillus sp. MER TA 81-3 TaxID=2939573 RepID=UPI00203F3AE6|nr:DUF6602 domain-containing protein [Paenibacillus sp. MER TA 81-3]MCM3341554.1 hypothetical protein [Paenibacillus sp. MER TA 81-3]